MKSEENHTNLNFQISPHLLHPCYTSHQTSLSYIILLHIIYYIHHTNPIINSVKNKCIYSRGLEKDYPYAHIVHQGPPKFIGFAFRVNKLEDLHTLANNLPNCTPVEEMTGIEGKLSNNPGIAKKVSFIDPVNGFLIEAVYGQKCDEIPSRHAQRILYNYGVSIYISYKKIDHTYIYIYIYTNT